MPAEYESPTEAQFLIQLRSSGSEPSRRSNGFAGVVLEGKQYDTPANDAQRAKDERPIFGTMNSRDDEGVLIEWYDDTKGCWCVE